MADAYGASTVRELEKPIILIGEEWRQAIDRLSDHILLREGDRERLIHAQTVDAVVAMLREHFAAAN